MSACRKCAAPLPPEAKFCPECGTTSAPDTRARSKHFDTARTVQEDSSTRPSSSSVHGRFDPGTRLGSRYRIVGLLGQGVWARSTGPTTWSSTSRWPSSFCRKEWPPSRWSWNVCRKEVRIAREISHPNVCRTYDISEAEGHVFLVMEYIDGEDLASVPAPYGPPDRATRRWRIARQMALGLAAAHENGVLHRDLKPANVMIDGRGRVRITDFGLAGLAEEFARDPQHAGTPAYMAPEQLQGAAATVASDIYALGLTLYEVFTGKRVEDQRRTSGDSSVTTPSTFAPEIDPAVERLLMQCLEEDPGLRPSSAYAVLGALPGGDPLAAAMAAGETPSPELVASSGGEGSIRPLVAGIWLVIALGAMIGAVALQKDRYALLDASATALTLEADKVLEAAGVLTPPQHTATGFMGNRTADAYYAARDSAGFDARFRRDEYPSRQMYYRRWSRTFLTPGSIHAAQADFRLPAYTAGDMVVVLDASGRLMALRIFPTDHPPLEPVPDWTSLLTLAGFDPESLTRVYPGSIHRTGYDSTAVWQGTSPYDSTQVTLTIAGSGGRPLQFWVSGPWGSTRDLDSFEEPFDDGVPLLQLFVFVLIPMVGGVLLARHNIRLGRGDRKGATRLAVVIFCAYMINHVLSLHIPEIGLQRALAILIGDFPIGHSLLHAVFIWFGYVAIEPYIRKLWPRSLVSWVRLSSGKFRDPVVGRDILFGGLVSGLALLVGGGIITAARRTGEVPQFVASGTTGKALLGIDLALGIASEVTAVSVLICLVVFTLLVVGRLVLRRNRLAAAALFVLMTLVNSTGTSLPFWPWGLFVGLLWGGSITYLVVRAGFLSTLVFAVVGQLLFTLPYTVDLTVWYSGVSLVGPAILTALMVYAFSTALGGRSLFKDVLGDSK